MMHGDRLRLAGREWEVITVFGHAPEQATLYCRELNVLISSDQVLPRITSNVGVWGNQPDSDPLSQFLGSLSRLGHLPAWHTWPGKLALAALTYFLVCLTWVFFRAQDFPTAWRLLRSMLGTQSGEPLLATWGVLSAALTMAGMLAVHWHMRSRMLHAEIDRLPAPALGLAWGGMLFLIAITQGGGNAFIYFQF
jgi:hypothetical protein